MPHLAVAAVGADRPGIVAAVTGVLVEAGCNLEDTSMTILGGHFAMMLVVAAPEDVSAPTLEASLADVADELGLVVAARPIGDEAASGVTGTRWGVSVYGADRPGIVHRVAQLLADRSVNIVDLSTRVIGDPERPVYAMLLEVVLPDGLDQRVLEAELAGLRDELGVECHMHRADADIL
jgi:glycine cleavage system transcriptional repressor